MDREWLARNMRTPVTNTSGYKGVSWSRLYEKREAYLHCGGRKYSGGLHRELEYAVAARKRLEKIHFKVRRKGA